MKSWKETPPSSNNVHFTELAASQCVNTLKNQGAELGNLKNQQQELLFVKKVVNYELRKKIHMLYENTSESS